MKTKRMIGFDRRIRLEWLDAMISWAAEELPLNNIRAKLYDLLEGHVSGAVKDGAQRKTFTVLARIWLTVPEELQSLRDDGLILYPKVAAAERMGVHWGMCIASYPFFREVVSQIGRLSKLQEELTLEQIRRRIIEQWGDTERVRRSARHVVQTLRDWEVLVPLERKGTYAGGKPITIQNPDLKSWLAEALILSNNTNMIPMRSLGAHPAFFPFSLSFSSQDIVNNPRLERFRQSLDEDVVMLRGKS